MSDISSQRWFNADRHNAGELVEGVVTDDVRPVGNDCTGIRQPKDPVRSQNRFHKPPSKFDVKFAHGQFPSSLPVQSNYLDNQLADGWRYW